MLTVLTESVVHIFFWALIFILLAAACIMGEVGSMVREAIKRGEQAIAEEAKANGAVHQNAK